MSTTPNGPTLEALTDRVAALEQALASLQPHPPTPAVPSPAPTAVEKPAGTRRLLRRAVAAAASLVGARLTGSSKTALAAEISPPGKSAPCVCSSAIATVPAVRATGTGGAHGVDTSSDSSVGLFTQSGSGISLVAVGGGASATLPKVGPMAIFASGGPSYGLYATSDSNIGVLGQSNSGIGVEGDSTNSPGVYGQSTNSFGVQGQSTNSPGVYGQSTNDAGVQGQSDSGIGVLAQSGSGIGLHAAIGGATRPKLSGAIYAEGGPSHGLYATSDSNIGVWGTSNSNIGVLAQNISGGTGLYALIGVADLTTPPVAAAICAEGGSSYGLYATSTSTGVQGQSESGTGIYGQSTSGTGVWGIGISGPGVQGQSESGTGVLAQSGSGIGLHAIGGGASPSPTPLPASTAIFAEGGPGYGVYATGGGGIYGQSTRPDGWAICGLNENGYAVWGISENKAAVIGDSKSGNAGLFIGAVEVFGPLLKFGGGFQIDHPLDAAHKYLSHSFVESADMKNLYDGVVTLDANGQAEVRLPDWFETLNTDVRYQLTCLRSYAPVYIAEQLQNNRFTIAGGRAGMEVCWQVTGIRQDRWANAHRIAVEQDKPANEQGYYLSPDLYGEPEAKSILHARYPDLQRPVPPQQ